MKNGKISENILKRSVLRQIKAHRSEIIKGAGIGEDCAFFVCESNANQESNQGYTDIVGTSTQTISLPVRRAGYLAVMAACNNLAASGVEPIAASASIVLPAETEEAILKNIIKQMDECCNQWNIELCSGHTEVSFAVNSPVITVTAMGRANIVKPSNLKSTALDLVVSKWVGLEGTAIAAVEKRGELAERYPQGMLRTAQEFEKYLSIAPEATVARRLGAYSIHDMRNGGIFGALWEMSQRLGVGLTVDLKKIPIKQETIEVCEFYNLNPYVFLSGGALLMVTQDGESLVEELAAAGILATVIGQTNGGNDKIITNRDEVRYLEPTMTDEIWKLSFNKEQRL